jgi:hypothetical protein
MELQSRVVVGDVEDIPEQVVRANRRRRALRAQRIAQDQRQPQVGADSKPDNVLIDRWERLAGLLFESSPARVERVCREAQVGLGTVQAFEEAGLVRTFDGKVALTFDGLASVVLNESRSAS